MRDEHVDVVLEADRTVATFATPQDADSWALGGVPEPVSERRASDEDLALAREGWPTAP